MTTSPTNSCSHGQTSKRECRSPIRTARVKLLPADADGYHRTHSPESPMPPTAATLVTSNTTEQQKHSPFFFGWTTFQQKAIGVLRILFGVMWAADAILKWQPAFIQSFADIIAQAGQGQPPIMQIWNGFWVHIVNINPTGFAVIIAVIESLLAICFILGVFTNIAAFIGFGLSFLIWAVPESFGMPYVAGQSTDIGTGISYMILCALLLLLGSGRYFGIDRVLTPKLGRFGFLAAGSGVPT